MPYFKAQGPLAHEGFIHLFSLCVFFIYAAISFVPTPGNGGAAESMFLRHISLSLAGYMLFWAVLVWRFCYYAFLHYGHFRHILKFHARKGQR